MVAAAGAWVGVEVHALSGRARAERGCTDEMDFALLTLLRETAATRTAALAAGDDVALEPVALAWGPSGMLSTPRLRIHAPATRPGDGR